MHDRYGIHPFPCDAARQCGRGEGCPQQPVTRRARRVPAGGDAEAAAQPRCQVRDRIDRTHPRAEHPSADEQVEGEDEAGAEPCRGPGDVSGSDRLQHEVRVGQRQDVQRQARRQVALDDPDSGDGARQEERQGRPAQALGPGPQRRGRPRRASPAPSCHRFALVLYWALFDYLSS